MDGLTSLLNVLGVGDVDDADELEQRLAELWSELDGSGDGGMAAQKLVGRMEQVRWNPPILQFVIERHGGTMCGSTRAELQHWEVDFDNRSARIVRTGHRQLYRMASRISIRGIAAEIVEAVVKDQNDSRVQRLDDGRVKVFASRVFPNGSGFKRTLLGRRK